jgi:hypothetical protein
MSVIKYTRAVLLSAAAACLAALSHGALAQQQEETTRPQQEDTTAPPAATAPRSPSAATIEDAKIDKFADAFVAVQDIQSKASQKLESTTDPTQAQQVKSSAENEMIQAVKKTGLEVEEFNQIVQIMASDNDLRTRVAAKIQQRTKG